MANSTSEPQSNPPPEGSDDWMKLYDLLIRADHKPRDAHELIRLIENMAGTNLIHRFENKLDSKLDTVTSKFNLLLWFIGTGVVILIALSVIGNFFYLGFQR